MMRVAPISASNCPMPPEPRPAREIAGALRLATALALGALGSACAVTPPPAQPAAAQAGAVAPASVSVLPSESPQRPAGPATAPSSEPSARTAAATPPANGTPGAGGGDDTDAQAAARLLRYAERVRALSPAELTLEVTAL